MKLRAILAILFIALLSLSTLVEARSSSTSSRSSSSSSRSSSSSSSYSTSNPTTTTSTPTSSYSNSYSTSSPTKATATTSTSKAAPSIGYPYKQPNPSYVPPKNTATHTTTTTNNRTVIYSNGVGGNGSTFFDSMLGTMAGMAVYDMITDDKGQTIKVEPYYVSGETRIPVGSGQVVPKEIEVPPAPDLPFDWTAFWYVVGGLSGIAFIGYLFVKP